MFQILCSSENKVIPIFYDSIVDAKNDAMNTFKYQGAQRIINIKTGAVVWDLASVPAIPSFLK